MNKKSLILGILVTAIWFIGIYVFSQSNSYNLPATLNELGDFLAGIFAPVAFFWLILGYVQQGKQLDQNTKALEQQETALRLQIDEMKESVQQQRELVLIQRQQNEDSNNSVSPYFEFEDLKIYCCGVVDIQAFEQEPEYELSLKLKNSGKEVREVVFLDRNEKPFLNLMRVNSETLDISICFSDLSLKWAGNNLMAKISIKSKNLFGRVHISTVLLNIKY